jgi:hypothetical protein
MVRQRSDFNGNKKDTKQYCSSKKKKGAGTESAKSKTCKKIRATEPALTEQIILKWRD